MKKITAIVTCFCFIFIVFIPPSFSKQSYEHSFDAYDDAHDDYSRVVYSYYKYRELYKKKKKKSYKIKRNRYKKEMEILKKAYEDDEQKFQDAVEIEFGSNNSTARFIDAVYDAKYAYYKYKKYKGKFRGAKKSKYKKYYKKFYDSYKSYKKKYRRLEKKLDSSNQFLGALFLNDKALYTGSDYQAAMLGSFLQAIQIDKKNFSISKTKLANKAISESFIYKLFKGDNSPLRPNSKHKSGFKVVKYLKGKQYTFYVAYCVGHKLTSCPALEHIPHLNIEIFKGNTLNNNYNIMNLHVGVKYLENGCVRIYYHESEVFKYKCYYVDYCRPPNGKTIVREIKNITKDIMGDIDFVKEIEKIVFAGGAAAVTIMALTTSKATTGLTNSVLFLFPVDFREKIQCEYGTVEFCKATY